MDSLDVHCYKEEADALHRYLLELKNRLGKEDQTGHNKTSWTGRRVFGGISLG